MKVIKRMKKGIAIVLTIALVLSFMMGVSKNRTQVQAMNKTMVVEDSLITDKWEENVVILNNTVKNDNSDNYIYYCFFGLITLLAIILVIQKNYR